MKGQQSVEVIPRRKDYGTGVQMTIERNEQGLIVLKGMAQGKTTKSIRATLSPHASSLLWHGLTQALYPDDIHQAAPVIDSNLPDAELMTSSIEVAHASPDHYKLVGRILAHEWSLYLSASEAKRLWAKLDLLLFPYGWQGRESHPAQS